MEKPRVIVGLAVAALVLASCTGSGGGTNAKTAKSAADFGGMDALVTAAKKEGALNVVALPPDWANYGQMIDDFSKKYSIKVTSDIPDGSSADEINAAKNNKGTDRAPDVFDLGANVALANTAMFAPYQVASWKDIADNLKEKTGLWVSDYAGYMSVGCDTAKVPLPKTMADLKDPKYKGMVALNGDPTQAAAGFNGVVMAALANGGSADDLAPGVAYFKALNDSGNLLPVDPNPATIKSGQTPCVIDWAYTNGAQIAATKDTAIKWQVTIPTDSPPVAAYYIQAINVDAPHPAAARLWQEYLYSVDGQNTWLKGFAVPVLFDKMVKDGTVDKDAAAALGSPSGTPVILTQDQFTKGQDYLKTNWTITIK
jgi:putative spermidine/putrescine transport system substrate-binding protein